MADVIEKLKEYAQYAETKSERDTFEVAFQEIARLREENARLQKVATPICVGRTIIGILAREGAWTSENGASVIAADELFWNDPYEEIANLRAALKPFVPEGAWLDPAIPDKRPIDVMVRAGELRAAAAAIREERK